MARRPRSAVRRGRFFDYPKTTAAVPARLARRTRARALVRRGEFFPGPWTQPVVAPPAMAPQWIAARRRTLVRPARRGEILPPPWPPTITPDVLFPPAVIEGRRPPRSGRRRGTFLTLPCPLAQPITPILRQRRRTQTARPGRCRFLWAPPPATLPPAGPGPWVPPILTRRRRPAPPRPASFFAPFLEGNPVPPVTSSAEWSAGQPRLGWRAANVHTGWSTRAPRTGWRAGNVRAGG